MRVKCAENLSSSKAAEKKKVRRKLKDEENKMSNCGDEKGREEQKRRK